MQRVFKILFYWMPDRVRHNAKEKDIFVNCDTVSEGPALSSPWKGVVYIATFFEGVLEPALVRRPTKKHLELQLCKGNALKIVRANPGLGYGPG